MGYPRHIFQKAKQELAERRQRAFETADRRKAEIYARLPEVRELDRKMAATGAGVIKAVSDGAADLPTVMERLKEENLRLQRERKALLESAGYTEADLQPAHTCPKCKDSGYIGAQRCVCFTQILKQLTYREIGSGWDLEQYTLDGFDLTYYPEEPDQRTQVIPRQRMREVYDYCVDYVKDFSDRSASLLFLGTTGLGKTHLSLAIAGEALARNYGVLYTSAQGMITKLEKEKFRRYSDEEEEESYLDRLMECDLLILDDLGAEFPSQFGTACVNDIIDSRLISGKPTVISSNLDGAAIRERYGARLLSRLLGSYKAFQFLGKDIRAVKRLQ